MKMNHLQKPKIVRVVTDGRVIPWHLEKTLRDIEECFDVIVVGEDVRKFAFPGSQSRYYDISITPKIRLTKDILGLIKLVILLLKERPEIIHSIMPKASLISALAAYFIVPYRFHTFTGQVWATKQGIGRSLLKYLDKLVVKLNTECLTDSKSQSDYLRENGICKSDGSSLPCLLEGSLGGVDLKKIDFSLKKEWRGSLREKYNIPEDKVVIGYLARKTLDKGALVFIELFKRIKNDNMIFMFVGPDDSAGEVTSLVECDLSDDSRFINIGYIDNHEQYLACFDILCLPSFREGFGSIVIDAAALGVPTVGSRIPGLVDAVVDGETGVLFPAGDINALNEIINNISSDMNKLSLLGENSRKRALNYFDSRLVSEKLIEFYRGYIDRVI